MIKTEEKKPEQPNEAPAGEKRDERREERRGAEERGGEEQVPRDEKGDEAAVDPPVPPRASVAHIGCDEVTMIGDEELLSKMSGQPESQAGQLAATASPDGKAAVVIPAEGNDEYVTRTELEQLIEEAYLRGLNEAVTKQIIADTTIGKGTVNMADDLAGLFAGRPSVWE